MIVKLILLVSFSLSFLQAQGYEFLETRYSDALDASRQLEGQIFFEDDSLLIKYVKEEKSLAYADGSVIYKDAEVEVELPLITQQKLSRYFEVLLLLHQGKVDKLEKLFKITKTKNKSLLEPRGSLKQHIQNIVLIKEETRVKEVILLLSNKDKISISLGNEVP